MPRTLWKPNIHRRVQNSPTHVLTLSQMDPVRARTLSISLRSILMLSFNKSPVLLHS